MSIVAARVGDAVVILGDPEPVEQFSTALLAAAGHTQWLTVDGDLIVIRDRVREVVYRITDRPATDAIDDSTYVTAELVSDSREAS